MKGYRAQFTCQGCDYFSQDWDCLHSKPYPKVAPNGVCDLWTPNVHLRDELIVMEAPLATGVINEYVMPCPRQTKHQRSKQYKVTKGIIGLNMVEAFSINGRIPQFPFIRGPFLFALVITMPPTKQSEKKGEPEFAETAGDYDNFVKGFLDAAKTQGVIKDDNPKHWRGIVDLGPKRSRVHLGSDWKFEWAFYAAD